MTTFLIEFDLAGRRYHSRIEAWTEEQARESFEEANPQAEIVSIEAMEE